MILPCLFTATTEQKGWGVFTHEAIAAETIVELSPVIVMSAEEKAKLDQTRLHDYIFYWEGDACCMAMGLIPVYNHSYQSNCEYFQDYDNNTIYIKTVRDIQAGEELCINYNGDWDNEEPLWFDVVD